MDNNVQNLYLGIYNGFPAFFFCILDGHFGLSNFKYVLYCMSNGIVFYLANYFTVIALKYIELSKFQPVTYLSFVFTFIIAATVLGEAIYFTDIVGAFFILAFQFYNMKFPPQVQHHVDINQENQNSK